MTSRRPPPFVRMYLTRHGKWRIETRKKGLKSVRLPGPLWSPAFVEAYQAWLDNLKDLKIEIGAARNKPGSINDLRVRFLRSVRFTSLRQSTQVTYQGIIDAWAEKNGDKSVASLATADVKRMQELRAPNPAAANNWLRVWRMLFDFAVDEGMRRDNPFFGVKSIRYASEGHAAWGADQLKAFRDHHATGTRERLAMELLYNTMQRRGDVVAMGRQNVSGGVLSIRQQKTGAMVDIPLLPELQAQLEHVPGSQMIFLCTEAGKPFTSAGFGNWFRDACDAAGLPKGYSAHGLRKAGAVRLAEAGCTEQEIKAWGGWTTLKEVQRYTAAASRKKLARSAAVKLTSRT